MSSLGLEAMYFHTLFYMLLRLIDKVIWKALGFEELQTKRNPVAATLVYGPIESSDRA